MKRIALASLLLLGGCFGGGDRATVDSRAVTAPRATQRMIGVQPGDTIADLAHRYDVSARDLIEANGLQPPYKLAAGTQLRFPVPRDYVVQPGDSLYGISRLFAVDQREIVRLNQLREPYEVKPGQTLRLPVRENAPATRVAAVAPPPAPTPMLAAPLPAAPVQASALPPARPATPAPQSAPTVLAPPAAAPIMVAPPQAAPLSAPPVSAPAAVAAAAAPVVQTSPPAAVPEDAAVPSGVRFLQPVAGRVLSAYGPKPDGLHNDGVNIAAPLGTPVKAADRGTVVYAGNELRGFGNLVLLKHADGFVTAYAHLDKIDVVKGDTVARGQHVGTVGHTGSVSEPQLHFELRRGAKAIDPSSALKSG
ncbi:MAG: gamma-D-glutamyl-meso-diaminopimelate peptidase [Rhodospirillales bacterium]|nr:gamma-D-glutamyl-meso-diaminopimelate peptidase [Rhodospirillales bacterium]